MASATSEGSIEHVAQIGSIRIGVALTDRPWQLGLDALVLSVGQVLGGLADAASAAFSSLPWDQINLDLISPASPYVLHNSSGVVPKVFILASAHRLDERRSVAVGSAAEATTQALRAAVAAGAASVGVPLVGAGRLALGIREMAEAIYRQVVPALGDLQDSVLEDVVLFDRARTTVDLIREVVAGGGRAATLSTELQGGIASDAVDAKAEITLDKDYLSIGPYVSMLATLVADATTPVPLSIGIFGEWGSGKSYFMGLLRGRISALADSPDERYVRRVKSVSFNAWHYADANLWASLADEIITQVVRADLDAAAAGSVQADLTEKLAQRSALDAEIQETEREAVELQSEIDAATESRRLSAGDLVNAVRTSSTARRLLDKLWSAVGLQGGRQEAAAMAADLGGAQAEALVLRRTSASRTGAAAAAVALALAAVAAVVAGVSPQLRAALGGVSAVLFSAAAAGATIALRLRNGMTLVRVLAGEIGANLDPRSAVDVKEKLQILHNAQEVRRRFVAQRELADARATELRQHLAELAPGARAYSQLLERASSDYYSSNLGVISTVRRDLLTLADLLAHRTDDEGADRIVLYIDDLDRCSPRRVMEVLQAVHLLLAVKLFVVVVGVDPRWLLRSLKAEHREILGADNGPALISPEDFLEKIINIPLMLPRMSAESIGDLIRGITTSASGAAGETAAPATDLIEAGSEVAQQEALTAAAGPSNAAPSRSTPRPLTDHEAELLVATGRFVDTPRDVKRLTNIYRMIRSTRDLSDAGRFLGEDGRPGDYQAVIPLLALSVYNARLSAAIVDQPRDLARQVSGGLLCRTPGSAWGDFIGDVAPQREPSSWRTGVVGEIPAADVALWARAYDGLSDMARLMTLADLAALQDWAPKVRRFSFAPWV